MLNEFLVCPYVEENSGTPPMLCKNQRTPRFAHLVHKCGGIGKKFGKASDIFSRENFRHDILLLCTSCGTITCTTFLDALQLPRGGLCGAITECCVWQVERRRRTLIGEQPMNAGSGELAGRVRRWNIGTRLSGKMKSKANDFGKTWTAWPLRVPVGWS